MSDMIRIDDELYFSPPEEKDIPAYVNYLNEKEIYDRTLMIPFPYLEKDARWWLDYCAGQKTRFGHQLDFAIRNSKGELLGGAGFHGKNLAQPLAHRDELGYWIAKPFWGKGIMTRALPVLISYGRAKRGLSRFEAPIFSFNIASERVLIKCGFKEEGYLRKVYLKDGQYFDGKLFALTL